MTGLITLASAAGILLAGAIAEATAHRRRLGRIPVRIHVNGTRGKSSVSRLIAAGLRASGLTTCCKTTGTLPRMILPDGKEFPVFRPARANVIEQVRIVRTALDAGVEALVLECMALQPRLQWLSENKLVQATHGVITNARADHLDVMGPDEDSVAWALGGMVPIAGKLFTAEQRHLDIFRRVCEDRETELIAVGQEEIDTVTQADLEGFPYMEHAENVALALRVCADLGFEKKTALQGMWEASPDPGAMTAHEMDFFGRSVAFVNGFAANDPESTERIWKMALEKYAFMEKKIALFNCRVDRPDRSRQLGEVVPSWPSADHYVLTGSGTYIFARCAAKAGLDTARIVFAEGRRTDEIFETCIELAGRSALVMGMANIGGPGLDIVRYFANRSTFKAFK